jgi:hypothetical protein
MSIRTKFRCFIAAAFVAGLCSLQAQAPPSSALDLHGQPVHQLAGPGDRIVVLIFAASDCPISNRAIPELNRITHEFAGKPVQFWWVYPNHEDSTAAVAEHRRAYSIETKALRDPAQALVAWAHATVTPEAAVFLVDGAQFHEVYKGRIDDQYISLGRERPQVTRHDLEVAINAALDGKTVPQPGGPSIGCSIVFLQK